MFKNVKTAEELLAEQTAKEKEQLRQQAKQERDQALANLTHTFADGSVVQVRPGDLPNFQIAINNGVDREWIMADNTVRLTTVTELQQAMADGITQGEAVWDVYMNKIKEIV
jgi:hypothetical protein